ncbi:hypothetical protein EON81_16790 [bacterium]|nr:MAG: hypothetical protein EON81_16790 [bacterium]
MPFLAVAALAASISVPLPIRVEGRLVHPHRFMVKAGPEADLSGYRVIARYPQIGWATVEIDGTVNPGALARLSERPGVAEASYDRAAQAAYTPNDPDWNQQWHLRTIKTDLAWDRSLGSNKITVAIMDTGVDVTHPDLAANIWKNQGEIPGNGLDDDGNGYVDDVNGYDFAYGDSDPADDNSHGTGCAGIAAAVGNNGIQISGVAPKARIMALKAAISSGYFYDSANIPAYLYAADNGAKVLSMSFYTDNISPSERDSLEYVLSKGCLPVAAAGNDATVLPYYPGAYESVVGVAAIDQNLGKSGFSDFGSWVDVAAPGSGLITTAPGGGLMGFGGTSGACPHVAGAAALLFGAVSSATPAKVRAVLEDTASPLVQAPFGEYTNYGLIDVDKALAQLKTGTAAAARTSLVRWVSPIGTAPGTTAGRIYGRSLHVGDLRLPVGNTRLVIRGARKRDYVDYNLSNTDNYFRVANNGVVLATIVSPEPTGRVWPFIEGVGRSGSTLTGGFYETLKRDRTYVTVAPTNGTSEMQGTFRRLTVTGNARKLVIKRRYSAGWTGTERIRFYDWSSNSYPYGNWIEIAATPTMSTFSEQTFTIPNFGRFIDYEGTAYISMTADGASNGKLTDIDCMYLKE